MGNLLTGIFVTDRTGVAFDAEDFFALKFHCDLAAHRAADTSQIPFFHTYSYDLLFKNN
jgi:hypothetical protein